MTTFDRVVAVDWSAASRPVRGADSIWVARAEVEGAVGEPVNVPTRQAAVDLLVELCSPPGRVLVVVDWSLGYPSGTAAAFDLGAVDVPPWRRLHDHLADAVTDRSDNTNDRFAVAADLNRRTPSPGPFWGAPASAVGELLSSGKQPFVDVPEWREAERRLRSARSWPSSCWQLAGAGAVGSQSLLGIARLAELRHRLVPDASMAIWPLETGLGEPDTSVDVVVAEMWPTLLAADRPLPEAEVRDAAQVLLAVERFREADRTGDLVGMFAPTVDDPAAVVGEEGWVLGLV